MHSRSPQNQNESIFTGDLQKTDCRFELKKLKKKNGIKSSENRVFKKIYKILKFKYGILR